jgi:exopolysaccharide biosynthesis polyprenyl glycosylphosphotransferase
MRWRHDATRRRMLALSDFAAVICGIAVVSTGPAAALWALLTLPVWILAAKLLGLYDRDHRVIRHLTIDELPTIFAWAAVVAVGTAFMMSLAPQGGLETGSLLAFVAVLGTVDVGLRVFARYLWRRFTHPERCLFIGGGDLVEDLRRKMVLLEDMHMVDAGVVDPTELYPRLERDDDSAREFLTDIDRVVIATTWLSPVRVGQLASFCRQEQVKLSAVSALRGRALPAARLSHVADLPVLEFDTTDVSRSTMAIKRILDVVLASAGLLFAIVTFPLIALAIKLDSRGPIFFTQRRAGLGGHPFRIFKYRSMDADAEERLDEVVRIDELEQPMFKLEADPRVTRVGRVLRRLSLDELPQMVNVLKGDMSLVGPRPEQLEVVRRYRPEDRFRLEVKPGITGPMQVNGRGQLTFSERLAVELDYVENLSPARDLRLLALTVPAVLKRHGAY